MKLDSLRRAFWQINFILIRNGYKKARYIKKHKIFAHIGENVSFTSNILPAEQFLVSIGNNVIVAANVRLITHSMESEIFNKEEKKSNFFPRFGEINIGNNVFIGADSIILPGVTIGNNVIIAAGSVVTKNIEDGLVVAGVPAKQISTYDSLKEKNRTYSSQFKNYKGSHVVRDLYQYLRRNKWNGY